MIACARINKRLQIIKNASFIKRFIKTQLNYFNESAAFVLYFIVIKSTPYESVEMFNVTLKNYPLKRTTCRFIVSFPLPLFSYIDCFHTFCLRYQRLMAKKIHPVGKKCRDTPGRVWVLPIS